MDTKHGDRIAITGIGLVTSLGLSAGSSLAAIRSGIANFSEHETVLVNGNTVGTELQSATVARVPHQAVGRQLQAADRAVALLTPAIRECCSGVPQSLLDLGVWRLSSGDGSLDRTILSTLRASGCLPLRAATPHDDSDSSLGRCLFFENMIRAARDLRNGSIPIALVGCVDSLCDPSILEQLADTNRLKCGTNPEGVVAGEAAGVFLLELESHAKKREAGMLGFLTAAGRGAEAEPWDRAPSTAQGLLNAIEEAFDMLPGKGKEIDLVISDLNGERVRAYEWALTAPRIFPNDDKVRGLEHPADCTGECGAAMGAVVLGTAIGLLPGRPPARQIALSTSDRAGARRVLCMEAGNVPPSDLLTANQAKPPSFVDAVIEQHHDDASFLWLLRQRLIEAPETPPQDLARYENRIEANLDGLHSAGEVGWRISETALRNGDAGDFFVASYLAFRSGKDDRIASVLEKAGTDIELSKGVRSAREWIGMRRGWRGGWRKQR